MLKSAAMLLIACATAASAQSLINAENLLFSPPKDFKGNDALCSVQRAWRSVPETQELDNVMHALAKVTVCDTRTPDHPCPSFDSLVTSPK